MRKQEGEWLQKNSELNSNNWIIYKFLKPKVYLTLKWSVGSPFFCLQLYSLVVTQVAKTVQTRVNEVKVLVLRTDSGGMTNWHCKWLLNRASPATTLTMQCTSAAQVLIQKRENKSLNSDREVIGLVARLAPATPLPPSRPRHPACWTGPRIHSRLATATLQLGSTEFLHLLSASVQG